MEPRHSAGLARATPPGVKAIKAKADAYAKELVPVVEELRREGVVSLGGIAQALNGRGILTPRGKVWHKAQVRALLARGWRRGERATSAPTLQCSR
jgi:hypothetical protein